MSESRHSQAVSRRLNGWKEIASFFGRDERTVKRWEQRGLPVHRVPGGTRASVLAYADELDAWLRANQTRERATTATAGSSAREASASLTAPIVEIARSFGFLRPAVAIGAAICLVLAAGLAAWQPWRAATPASQTAGAKHVPQPEALDLYLTGMYQWNTRTPQGLNRAVHYFTEAIALDPAYADPYAGLANSYNLLSQYTIMPPEETYPRAKVAAERALALDPGNVAALNALAFNTFYWSWDLSGARHLFERALAIDPRSADGLHWFALVTMHTGEMNEPIRAITEAQRVAPDSRSILANKALILFHAGRANEAIPILRQMKESDPKFLSPRAYLATIYLDGHRYRDFLAEAGEAARLQESPDHIAIVEAARDGFNAGGRDGMLRAMMAAQKIAYGKGTESAFKVARTAALLGERQTMLEFLDISISRREPEILGIRVEPAFRAVHGDPEYRSRVTRVGLPLPPTSEPASVHPGGALN